MFKFFKIPTIFLYSRVICWCRDLGLEIFVCVCFFLWIDWPVLAVCVCVSVSGTKYFGPTSGRNQVLLLKHVEEECLPEDFLNVLPEDGRTYAGTCSRN
jgi:hypothetical protein